MAASDASASSAPSRSIQLEIQVPNSTRPNSADNSASLADQEATEQKVRALAVYRHVYYIAGIVSVVVGALFFVFQVIAMRFYSRHVETGAGLWSGCAFGLINGSLALRAATSKQFSLRWARITFGFSAAALFMHALLIALSVLELFTMDIYDDYISYRQLVVFMVMWSPVYGITAGILLLGIDIYYLIHAFRLRRLLAATASSDEDADANNSIVTYLPNVDGGGGTIQVTVKVNPSSAVVPQDRILLLRRVAIATHSMIFVAVCSILLGCWLMILDIICYQYKYSQVWIGLWAGFLPAVINACASLQHARAVATVTSGRRVKIGLTIAAITLVLFIACMATRIVGVVTFPGAENRRRMEYIYHSGNTHLETAYVTMLMNLPVIFAAMCIVIYQLANLEALYSDAVGKQSNRRVPDSATTSTDQQNASETSNELLQENKRKYAVLAKHADNNTAQPSVLPSETTA